MNLKEAIAKHIADNPTAKAQEPATKTAIIRIIAIEEMEINGKVFIAVTGENTDGDEVQLSASTNMLDWNKDKLQLDGVCKAEFEVRIKDKTAYINEAGELKFHTSNSNDIRKVFPASVSAFERAITAKLALADEEAILSKLDTHGEAGMSAIAGYRTGTFQYRK